MDVLILALLAVLPALVIVGGLNDLITMKIPNWVSLALMAGFLPAAFAVGLDLHTIALHVGIGLIALFAGAGMFALRWIGGGDAKLMASSCLWLGATGSTMFLLFTGVVGGLFCLSLMYARQNFQVYAAAGPSWVGRLMEPKGDIPYGVAIAIGALIAYPASSLMTAFIGG